MKSLYLFRETLLRIVIFLVASCAFGVYAQCIFNVDIGSRTSDIQGSTTPGHRLKGLRTPTKPGEIANKYYVDSRSGLINSFHLPTTEDVHLKNIPASNATIPGTTYFARESSAKANFWSSYYLYKPDFVNHTNQEYTFGVQFRIEAINNDETQLFMRYRNGDFTSQTANNWSNWLRYDSGEFSPEWMKVGGVVIGSTGNLNARNPYIDTGVPRFPITSGSGTPDTLIINGQLAFQAQQQGNILRFSGQNPQINSLSDELRFNVINATPQENYITFQNDSFRNVGDIAVGYTHFLLESIHPTYPAGTIYSDDPNNPVRLSATSGVVNFTNKDALNPSFICVGDAIDCWRQSNFPTGGRTRVVIKDNNITSEGTNLVISAATPLTGTFVRPDVTLQGTATDITSISASEIFWGYRDSGLEVLKSPYLTFDPGGSGRNDAGVVHFLKNIESVGKFLIGDGNNGANNAKLIVDTSVANNSFTGNDVSKDLLLHSDDNILHLTGHVGKLSRLDVGDSNSNQYTRIFTDPNTQLPTIETPATLTFSVANSTLSAGNRAYQGILSLDNGIVRLSQSTIDTKGSTLLLNTPRDVYLQDSDLTEVQEVHLQSATNDLIIKSHQIISPNGNLTIDDVKSINLSGQRITGVPDYGTANLNPDDRYLVPATKLRQGGIIRNVSAYHADHHLDANGQKIIGLSDNTTNAPPGHLATKRELDQFIANKPTGHIGDAFSINTVIRGSNLSPRGMVYTPTYSNFNLFEPKIYVDQYAFPQAGGGIVTNTWQMLTTSFYADIKLTASRGGAPYHNQGASSNAYEVITHLGYINGTGCFAFEPFDWNVSSRPRWHIMEYDENENLRYFPGWSDGTVFHNNSSAVWWIRRKMAIKAPPTVRLGMNPRCDFDGFGVASKPLMLLWGSGSDDLEGLYDPPPNSSSDGHDNYRTAYAPMVAHGWTWDQYSQGWPNFHYWWPTATADDDANVNRPANALGFTRGKRAFATDQGHGYVHYDNFRTATRDGEYCTDNLTANLTIAVALVNKNTHYLKGAVMGFEVYPNTHPKIQALEITGLMLTPSRKADLWLDRNNSVAALGPRGTETNGIQDVIAFGYGESNEGCYNMGTEFTGRTVNGKAPLMISDAEGRPYGMPVGHTIAGPTFSVLRSLDFSGKSLMFLYRSGFTGNAMSRQEGHYRVPNSSNPQINWASIGYAQYKPENNRRIILDFGGLCLNCRY